MDLTEGKIVWLKSGGPAMTVKFYHTATDLWRCKWFDEKKNSKEAGFTKHQLTDINPNKNATPPRPRIGYNKNT